MEVSLPNKQTFKVRQYLSTKEKSDIINFVKETCYEDLIDYNLIESLFYGSMIMMYTDLTIDESEEITNDLVVSIFDYYESNGYTADILGAIPEEEKSSLRANFEKSIEELNELKFSNVTTLQMVMEKLPTFLTSVKALA